MGEIKVLKFRDIQVAEDVAKKSELGWFDVEFIMYGCAYLDCAQDKVYYKVSSKEKDIYDFIEACVQNDIYPSKVMSIRKRYPLPAGMKDIISETVKKELAQELRKAYPKSFFYLVNRMAEMSESNTAVRRLWIQAEQLEGRFVSEELQQFEALVWYARNIKIISKEEFEKLSTWVAEERDNFEDDFIGTNTDIKVMYGIAYEKKA